MNEIKELVNQKLGALKPASIKPKDIMEWISSHPKEVTAVILVYYFTSQTGLAFSKLKTIKTATPSYQDIVPINLSLRGRSLRFATWLLSTRFAKWMHLRTGFLALLSIPKFRQYRFDEQATYYPLVVEEKSNSKTGPTIGKAEILAQQDTDLKRKTNFKYLTSSDYIRAYKAGTADPVSVARSLIQNIKLMNTCLNGICDWNEQMLLKQAEESCKRWKAGKLLSPVDGVPVVVKDHLPVKGLITRNGCSRDISPDAENCVVVQRLLDSGLIIIGISSMTQRGCSAMGYNPSRFHGTVKNAVNPDYYPGGSSSGTAACVASGLVPFGIGTDGGGSIRIPRQGWPKCQYRVIMIFQPVKPLVNSNFSKVE